MTGAAAEARKEEERTTWKLSVASLSVDLDLSRSKGNALLAGVLRARSANDNTELGWYCTHAHARRPVPQENRPPWCRDCRDRVRCAAGCAHRSADDRGSAAGPGRCRRCRRRPAFSASRPRSGSFRVSRTVGDAVGAHTALPHQQQARIRSFMNTHAAPAFRRRAPRLPSLTAYNDSFEMQVEQEGTELNSSRFNE